MPPTITVKVEIPVTLQRIADLLCEAFEGGQFGCGYWARIADYKKPRKAWTDAKGEKWPRYVAFPISKGGAVIIEDLEDDSKRHTLDMAAIERGLRVMHEKAPGHFARWLTEDDDAETGDVFVQCCVFGELIYG